MKRALLTSVALVFMVLAWQPNPGCSSFTGPQQLPVPNDIGEPGAVAEEQVAPQESATVFCPPEIDDATGEPTGRWLSLTGKPWGCVP